MADRVFIGFIERTGILTIDQKPAFAQHLKALTGQEVEVVVRKRRFIRSLAQNRYYWGVIVKALSEHTGYEKDEMHATLKTIFLPKHLVFTDTNGSVTSDVVIGGSTTKLSTDEFSEYCATIQRTAAEGKFGQPLYIPDPDEPFPPGQVVDIDEEAA